MSKEIRAFLDSLTDSEINAGKITLVTVLSGAIVAVMTFGAYFQLGIPRVNAATGTSTVTTSVTVLNTPPVWTTDARESSESSTSTPTQSGYTMQWLATGTDSNSDSYYLLICYGTSTTAAPTPHASGVAPTCGSGALQWAISSYTTSGQIAYAATTTLEKPPFITESNVWYAWVCDAAALNPSCNSVGEQGYEYGANNGSDYTKISPFVINHAPVFTFIATTTPALPGNSISWTVTASDTDGVRGIDRVSLWVCKTASFATSSCTGGLSNTWASSTVAQFNPATTTLISVQNQNIQDKTYDAFVYIQDTAGHQATSTFQGLNATYRVLNATPTVSNVTFISTSSPTDIQLFRPHATSGPYEVHFTVTDTNSCQNALSGNEIVSATTSVYRSAMTTCTASSTLNTNMCYPSADTQTQIVCTQDSTGDTCTGSTDQTVGWTCTIPLWYNADPTDVGSVFAAQNWLATVVAIDDNYATSTQATSPGTEVDKFLAFSVSTTSIAYGGLQPNQSTPGSFTQTTDLNAWGNTGIDEMLFGDTMCIGWTAFGSCDTFTGGATFASSSMIASWNQQAATSSVPFSDPKSYALHASSTPLVIALGVPKTTSTSSPQSKNTYWGIHIPTEITQSGSYLGQNVIGAVVSNTNYW